tara:strand:+ start:834 stop:998 length:165 start_codon:yes stop_codon:yes gene_type:complete
MDRQGMMAIMIVLFRAGGCYGLWLQNDVVLKMVGLFFAIAEVINLLAKVDKWEG